MRAVTVGVKAEIPRRLFRDAITEVVFGALCRFELATTPESITATTTPLPSGAQFSMPRLYGRDDCPATLTSLEVYR